MCGDLAQGSRHLAFQAIYVRGNSRQKSNGAPLPFKCSYQPMRFYADASVVSFLCINYRPATSHMFGLPCWGIGHVMSTAPVVYFYLRILMSVLLHLYMVVL